MSLARVYRRFAEDIARTSPAFARMALALSESPEALRAIESAPARRRQPALVLAALHELALTGRAPALAEDWGGDAAVGTLLELTNEVVATVVRRQRTRTDEVGRCAVLHPAVAEAAHRAAARAVGLVDVGCSAGFNLLVDRVGISCDNGQTLGDPASPVQLSVSVVGRVPLPAHVMPEVVVRTGVDRDPVDVTDPDGARWLRACEPPDAAERAARLEAAMELAASGPPLLVRGDPVEVLPHAIARVPAHALPVVTTTWAVSQLRPGDRLRLVGCLEEAAAGRPVAWVSVEGVGVAPGVPTLGDRPASGHSIIGVASYDGPTRRTEALGRCWSRGRLLSWLEVR